MVSFHLALLGIALSVGSAQTLALSISETCPSCPTAQAAREAFFRDDVLTRLSGALAPVVVSAGLVGLVVSRLRGRTDGRGSDELEPEKRR